MNSPTNEEIYTMIEQYAERKIPDVMRRTAFLTNAYTAYRTNNRQALLRYLQRVRPPVQGGRVCK